MNNDVTQIKFYYIINNCESITKLFLCSEHYYLRTNTLIPLSLLIEFKHIIPLNLIIFEKYDNICILLLKATMHLNLICKFNVTNLTKELCLCFNQ